MKYMYFVCYSFYKTLDGVQSLGFGQIEMCCNEMITCIEDIDKIKKYLDKDCEKKFGGTYQCIIMNYIFLRKEKA